MKSARSSLKPFQEIHAERPKSAWGLVDLFSGCGGTSEGFLASGRLKHLYSADIDRWANATYAANIGAVPEATNLAELAVSRSLQRWAGDLRREADEIMLAACAPCQGFSSHSKMRGDRKGLNPLLETIGQFAAVLNPQAIFVENVPDLFADRNWESFQRLREALTGLDYDVQAAVVNFAELGVPQERFRAVIVARRGGAATLPQATHRPGSFATVRDYIGDLSIVASGELDPADSMHQASRHRADTVELIEQVPSDGGSRPEGAGPECLDRARGAFGGYTDVYGRLWWDRPAPTITARCRTPSCGRFAHPEQHRGLTVREAALLQTFPRDWQFAGPFDDRFKQIGNAVPPKAARAFADHILGGWITDSDRNLSAIEIGEDSLGQSFSVLIPGIRRRRHAAVAA